MQLLYYYARQILIFTVYMYNFFSNLVRLKFIDHAYLNLSYISASFENLDLEIWKNPGNLKRIDYKSPAVCLHEKS